MKWLVRIANIIDGVKTYSWAAALAKGDHVVVLNDTIASWYKIKMPRHVGKNGIVAAILTKQDMKAYRPDFNIPKNYTGNFYVVVLDKWLDAGLFVETDIIKRPPTKLWVNIANYDETGWVDRTDHPITLKLNEEHRNEIRRKRAETSNFGWANNDYGITSKTSRGILDTEIDPNTLQVWHTWSSYPDYDDAEDE